MEDISGKVYAAMRSLYRFAELKKMGGPSILLDNEKDILMRYLSNLNPEDILFISKNFNSYYDEQCVQSALEDIELKGSFERYVTELN